MEEMQRRFALRRISVARRLTAAIISIERSLQPLGSFEVYMHFRV
jgi:hypothetical protein